MTIVDLTKNGSKMYTEINHEKLIDLLYTSDYEIEKIKNENEKLKKENVQLKKKLQSLQKILHLVEVVDKYE